MRAAPRLSLFMCALAHLLAYPDSLSQAFAFQVPRSHYPQTSFPVRKRGIARRNAAAGAERQFGDVATLSITTFNVLAPIFKRVGTGRESEFRDSYLDRHRAILEHLKGVGSDVICLQELWVAEQEMVDMYQSSLEGYRMYTLPRTESRGDGVACFVKDGIEVLDRQDLRLKGVGGRVALILRLGLGGGAGRRREVVVANTHLLFPHARTFSILRIREVKKLLAFVECYTQVNELGHLPVVLCGDFNGRSAGRVYQHLTERGFRCSYEDTLASGADFSRWITHLNHLGEELGVDYVWYRNFDAQLGPVEPEWESIVYQSTKQQLLSGYDNTKKKRLEYDPKEALLEQDKVSLEEAAAAAAAAAAGLSFPERTPAQRALAEANRRKAGDIGGGEGETDRLAAAVQLLGLSEGFELSEEELKLLLDSSADDFDFLIPTILDGSSTGLEGATNRGGSGAAQAEASRPGGCRLKTISSRIWPRDLEQGVWPKDYVISDHGSLTASFRVAPPLVVDSGDDNSAPVSSRARGVASGDAATRGGVGVSREGPDGGSSEARDWDAGEDGHHYGLR